MRPGDPSGDGSDPGRARQRVDAASRASPWPIGNPTGSRNGRGFGRIRRAQRARSDRREAGTSRASGRARLALLAPFLRRLRRLGPAHLSRGRLPARAARLAFRLSLGLALLLLLPLEEGGSLDSRHVVLLSCAPAPLASLRVGRPWRRPRRLARQSAGRNARLGFGRPALMAPSLQTRASASPRSFPLWKINGRVR